MKSSGIFLMIICFGVCIVGLQLANADTMLDLWMTGKFDPETMIIDANVHRINTEFGLGSLSYDMQFSELLQLTRLGRTLSPVLVVR